jgi:uncharacterized membrane protein YsdA (DUF1294 family)
MIPTPAGQAVWISGNRPAMANPYLMFALLGVGGAALVTLLLSQFLPPLLVWLGAINLSAIIIYRVDKSAAQAGRLRVPEVILLLMESIGGTIGAWFAMWMMRPRHKTKSAGFLFWFFAIFVFQVLGTVLFFSVK